MIKITLPFPHRFLSPNVSYTKHYMAMSPIKKAAKDQGRLAAAGMSIIASGGNMPVEITFYEPDKRNRDWDNLAGSLKHQIDGICEVLGINDKRLRPITLNYEIDKLKPRVEITIKDA